MYLQVILHIFCSEFKTKNLFYFVDSSLNTKFFFSCVIKKLTVLVEFPSSYVGETPANCD